MNRQYKRRLAFMMILLIVIFIIPSSIYGGCNQVKVHRSKFEKVEHTPIIQKANTDLYVVQYSLGDILSEEIRENDSKQRMDDFMFLVILAFLLRHFYLIATDGELASYSVTLRNLLITNAMDGKKRFY